MGIHDITDIMLHKITIKNSKSTVTTVMFQMSLSVIACFIDESYRLIG